MKPYVVGIIISIIMLGLGLSMCSQAISQWSPEHQAAATAMLRMNAVDVTATARYNEEFLPTIQAVQAEEEAGTAKTIEGTKRAIAITGATVLSVIFIATGAVGVSWAVRHWKSTCTLVATRPLSRKPIHLMPNGYVYDWRNGAVDDTGLPAPADLDRLQATNHGDAERIAAVAAAAQGVLLALSQKPSAQWGPADRRQLSWATTHLLPGKGE